MVGTLGEGVIGMGTIGVGYCCGIDVVVGIVMEGSGEEGDVELNGDMVVGRGMVETEVS